MYTCPANHSSETPGFCSVCGLEIPGGASTASTISASPASAAVVETGPVAAPATGAGGEACPDCGAARESDRHLFCEVCGYNFVTRAAGSGPPPFYVPAPAANSPAAELAASRGEVPASLANHATEGFSPAPAATPLPSSVPAEVETQSPAAATACRGAAVPDDAARWELILTVDANLYGTPNPDAPVGQPPRKFRLFDRETMIGRAGTEVRVQVPVHGDAGVSRRQVLLIQGPDGSLLLRDLNSANGTQVDGVDVLPGVDTVLHDSATIAMGAWTSIIVRAIGAS